MKLTYRLQRMKVEPLKVRRYCPRRLSRAHSQQNPSVEEIYDENLCENGRWLKIMMVEGITSRVADHIWGGCGPPSVYTESELNLENHRTFRKYKLSIEFQSKSHLEGVLRDRGWWTALRKKT